MRISDIFPGWYNRGAPHIQGGHTKTIVIVSDLHCGSVYGITPPGEFKASKYRDLQEESWKEYTRLTDKWKKPDILICNGDAIEGNQPKQGGAELVNIDRSVQCDIAVEALELWKAKRIFLSYGSAYHVGVGAEDFERGIAERLTDRGTPAMIEGHLFLNIEGLVFDIRHKVGTSSIPHGRATPLLREMMWALMKEANETGPKVDVIIRSHAHYYIDIRQPKRRAIITPGLQLARGRFGSRECSGEIHWGAIKLVVDKGSIIEEDVEICRLRANKPRVCVIK